VQSAITLRKGKKGRTSTTRAWREEIGLFGQGKGGAKKGKKKRHLWKTAWYFTRNNRAFFIYSLQPTKTGDFKLGRGKGSLLKFLNSA